MSATTRPAPLFIADHLALDFLNTLAVPADTAVEWLTSGEDLLAWLKRAGLVPEAVLDDLRRHAGPRKLAAVTAQARSLRDWFRSFVHKNMGKPLPATALRQLEPLNRLLRRDEEFGQIVVRDRRVAGGASVSGVAWRFQRHWKSSESLLFPLARVLADLVCTEDFTYVKACEGPMCTLLFIDRTRGHVRRWCSMAVCGNRAKQSVYRKRAREASRSKR